MTATRVFPDVHTAEAVGSSLGDAEQAAIDTLVLCAKLGASSISTPGMSVSTELHPGVDTRCTDGRRMRAVPPSGCLGETSCGPRTVRETSKNAEEGCQVTRGVFAAQ